MCRSLSKRTVARLEVLHLTLPPVWCSRDIEYTSSYDWSEYQNSGYPGSMETITTVGTRKYEIPCCESKNHANSPEIRKCSDEAQIRHIHPPCIDSLGQRIFHQDKWESERTEKECHNTTSPQNRMQQNILPTRTRRYMFFTNISNNSISERRFQCISLCTLYFVLCTFYIRHR